MVWDVLCEEREVCGVAGLDGEGRVEVVAEHERSRTGNADAVLADVALVEVQIVARLAWDQGAAGLDLDAVAAAQKMQRLGLKLAERVCCGGCGRRQNNDLHLWVGVGAIDRLGGPDVSRLGRLKDACPLVRGVEASPAWSPL